MNAWEDQERFARTAPKPWRAKCAIWYALGVITGLLLAVWMSPLLK